MISPRESIEPSDVARHYDELDGLYRDAWGEHLHHGLWRSTDDSSSIEEATLELLRVVTQPLQLTPNQKVADIGCGYGASARWVAEQHQVNVLGLTVSERQVTLAKQSPQPSKGEVDIILQDWLCNSIPSHSLDAAYSIEALAHMPDKKEFFHQLQRTLKPGSPATISCWLAPSHPSPLEKLLLRALCREGRLPHLGTLQEYTALAENEGLEVLNTEDFSTAVERTWWIISKNVLIGLFTKPHYLRFLRQRLFRQPLFLFTLPRLLLAYRIGAIRYSLLHLRASPTS